MNETAEKPDRHPSVQRHPAKSGQRVQRSCRVAPAPAQGTRRENKGKHKG